MYTASLFQRRPKESLPWPAAGWRTLGSGGAAAWRWCSGELPHSDSWLVNLFCSSWILDQQWHTGIGSIWTSTLAWQYLQTLRLQVGPYGSWTDPWGSWKGEATRRWAATSSHIPLAFPYYQSFSDWGYLFTGSARRLQAWTVYSSRTIQEVDTGQLAIADA